MNRLSKRHLLLPLLVLSMTLATAATIRVPASHAQGTAATLQVNFGTGSHWGTVHGTRVREIRSGDRPDYDMFRYGNSYYVYNNNRWYSSRRGRGEFRVIDDRYVPREFSRVPRDHWRNYPSGWGDKGQGPGSNGPGRGNMGNGNHK